ncbi:carbonic anhydrase 4b [Girardinichthys multiradiatus]|uniref:carbonic anhydrase 4b n=1 Tax=Girardinichthys multiradiatus TaxID=208333 RepID=UPI001FAC5892|nr:carbonic anhydrase 4b [Girardinichthys multiradiatus]
MQFAVLLFLLPLSRKIVSGSEWCYQSQVSCNSTCAGPDMWQDVSKLCSGTSQSPVNIMTRRMHLEEKPAQFHLDGYQETFHGNLTNTGHTVQLDLPSSIMISGGHLAKNYKAIQLHLHWGKNGAPGSEHTIDGEQFPMEMHIVHIKEEYNSLSQAVKDHTGVAVLGFLFQESQSINKNYTSLVEVLPEIIKPSNSTMLKDVSLEMLIPPQENLTKYFRYNGSLTTPECAEAVVWTVFENTIPMSREQLTAFNQLKFSDGAPMVQTYRPVQPLNGRLVYYSKGDIPVVSWVLLIMSVLFASPLPQHSDG